MKKEENKARQRCPSIPLGAFACQIRPYISMKIHFYLEELQQAFIQSWKWYLLGPAGEAPEIWSKDMKYKGKNYFLILFSYCLKIRRSNHQQSSKYIVNNSNMIKKRYEFYMYFCWWWSSYLLIMSYYYLGPLVTLG